MIRTLAVLILFVLFGSGPFRSWGAIRIVCPYAGLVHNTVSMNEKGIALEDRAPLGGLLLQWIEPSRFQANTFIYFCPSINYSSVTGLALSADGYLQSRPKAGRFVYGTGLDFVKIRTQTRDKITRIGDLEPLHLFDMSNAIMAPFVRTGYRLEIPLGFVRFAVFPWAGAQWEFQQGQIQVVPTRQWTTVFEPIRETISQDHAYGLAGLGGGLNLFHFLDFEIKAHRMLNESRHYDHVSAMANLFLSRKWGISYRLRSMETSAGTNRFHLFGMARLF